MCLLLSAPKITKIYAQEGRGGVWFRWNLGFFRQRVLSMKSCSACLICTSGIIAYVKDRGPDMSISSVLDLRKLSHIFNNT